VGCQWPTFFAPVEKAELTRTRESLHYAIRKTDLFNPPWEV